MSSTTHGTPQYGASGHSAGAQPPLPPAPPSRPGTPGKALSIVGIVLGGLALLLSWVPIVNNLAFVLGLVGLVLGIIGLVLAIRKHGAKALSIVAVVLSVLSLVVVFATQAFYSAVLEDVSDALDETSSESSIESVADTGSEGEGTAGPSSDGSDSGDAAEEPAAGPASTSLSLGEQATAGRYLVTVDAVDLEATDAVVAANTFNEAPENGQYVTADLTVTFEGDGADEGMPLFDLDVELLGGDQRNYATYECMASLGDFSEQTDGLRAGGSSSFQVCFDIPEAAAEGAEVRVEDQLDFGSDPVVWAIP
ncbi:hypothetical protein [Citricoccus nitrophenolicus]|uniref:hypothetical protein n=1 Tax=Citricoccus nitrophenolicus TaxID=863575 RepID=UPI0039B47143